MKAKMMIINPNIQKNKNKTLLDYTGDINSG